MIRHFRAGVLIAALCVSPLTWAANAKKAANSDSDSASAEHSDIGVTSSSKFSPHTQNPDAQWYPEAGLGLFLHWGISSVGAMNISWPMVPGRALGKKKLSPAEIQRVIRENDYNLNGKPNSITPNEYWAMAKDFNPKKYDPNKWLKAVKDAGFTYVVLTTRHHEGFALWPSAYGNFSTSNYMGGRDLLKPYVDACRRNGLKVGFYYSPPNWYFEKDYKDFLYGGAHRMNDGLPALDADLKPRTTTPSPEALAQHNAAYNAMVKGQVEELLTRYGKIDLLWFDGKPPTPNGHNCITIERIRELQPGIVINPRLHGHGDFVTYERVLGTDKPVQGWAEFCNTWTGTWSYTHEPFRSDGFVLGQFVTCRAFGVNYLLGVGPTADGEFCDDIYKNLAVVGGWMKQNGASVHGTKPLSTGESASVPATASASARYLFALPTFKDDGMYDEDLLPPKNQKLVLNGIDKPASVNLLADGSALRYAWAGRRLTVELPANKRTRLVDVVQVNLPARKK